MHIANKKTMYVTMCIVMAGSTVSVVMLKCTGSSEKMIPAIPTRHRISQYDLEVRSRDKKFVGLTLDQLSDQVGYPFLKHQQDDHMYTSTVEHLGFVGVFIVEARVDDHGIVIDTKVKYR